MDSMPLQDDPPSDFLQDEFHECDTWEDDGGLLFGDI
jgi:hypothetical protein